MARKKHSPEQIVAILRQIEVEVANHKPTGQVSRAHCEPDADPVHHSRGLYLHRSLAALANQPSYSRSHPGSTADRNASGAEPVGSADHRKADPRRKLRRRVACQIAVARTNLALRNQPILVLVARSPSALQVEFVGAAANLFFEINRNQVGRLLILASFGRTLHSGRLNGGSGFLAAIGGTVSGCLASHTVLLTNTQVQEWSYVMNQRHARTPIGAIRLFAMNPRSKYNANACGRVPQGDEKFSLRARIGNLLDRDKFALPEGDKSTLVTCRKLARVRRMEE